MEYSIEGQSSEIRQQIIELALYLKLSMTDLCYVQVAAEVAAPLSQVNKVTMVSCGGSEVGAAKLTGEVLNIVQCIPTLVKGVTGVDVTKVFLHLSHDQLS